MRLFKQNKLRASWLGALQVQASNIGYYTVWYSNIMLATTFWYTAGYEIAQEYIPWLSFWKFVLITGSSLAMLLLLDYKFLYPLRQAFQNAQACKHENPAMDALRDIQKRLTVIEKVIVEKHDNESN